MKRINIYIALIFVLSGMTGLMAQQEPLYTQFMFNKLALNPGYAGSVDGTSLTALYRNQWIGFDGAPESMVFGINYPTQNEKIGLGFNLARHVISISQFINAEASYAYRLKLGDGKLGLGVSAAARFFQSDYSDPRLQAVQDIGIDGAIDGESNSKIIPNFGFGAYYSQTNLYFGFSIPRLFNASIDFEDLSDVTDTEVRHLYLMAGYSWDISRDLSIIPQLFIKIPEDSPFDVDINVNALISETYTLGMTYRTGGFDNSIGQSIDLIAGAQISQRLYAGLAYDISLTKIRKYEAGSIEATLRYLFIDVQARESFDNPRYF